VIELEAVKPKKQEAKPNEEIQQLPLGDLNFEDL